MKKSCWAIFLFVFTLLSACSTKEAPIVEGWKEANAESSTYRVQKEDTIYSIAWAFGMDYHTLANLNHLKPPYQLTAGQVLRMSSSAVLPADNQSSSTAQTTQTATTYPAGASATTYAAEGATSGQSAATSEEVGAAPEKLAYASNTPKGSWLWPTRGKVIRVFSTTQSNKGLDIAGQLDQPVVATTRGKVVYTGASLAGYGNLIIIKHSDSELSAYAFNKVIAVKEGEVVQAGQMIARMGKNESGKTLLHFEIRKNGKPVDPISYLAKR